MYDGFDSFHQLASESAAMHAQVSYLKSVSHYLLKEVTTGSLAAAVDSGDELDPAAAESTVNLLESWMMADYALHALNPSVTRHLKKLDETEQGYWESGEQNVLPIRLQHALSRFEAATTAVYELDVELEAEYGVSISELRSSIDPAYNDQLQQLEQYHHHTEEADRALATAEEVLQPTLTDMLTGRETELPPADTLGDALGHAYAHITRLSRLPGPYDHAEQHRIRYDQVLHALEALSPQQVELPDTYDDSASYDLSE